MQRRTKFKQIILLLIMALPTVWCRATIIHSTDGNSAIQIKESNVQHTPKGSTIQASIYGHTLTVVFTENLGQVAIEIATASGTPVECTSIQTPNGLQIFIPNAGDYIVTFTLPNGDEYYGEFTVTD